MTARQFYPLLVLTAASLMLLAGCAPATKKPQPGPGITEQAEQSADPAAAPPEPTPPATTAPAPEPMSEPPATPEPQVASEPEPEPRQVEEPTPEPQAEPEPVAVPEPETPAEPTDAASSSAEEPDDSDQAQSAPGEIDVAAPLAFTLDELPITIENTWILKSTVDSCSLHTQTRSLDDGAGETPVSLVLTQDKWTLHTKSNIDDTYTGTGLDLDNGGHFDLEKVVKETNIEFVEQYQALIDAMHTANSMTVALGFWPSWPVTEVKTTAFPVAHFELAYRAWQSCSQRINAR